MKKKVLLVGASSEAAKNLFTNYSNDYDFIRLSREDDESDVTDFDILNPDTFFKIETNIDGIVYYPGTINLKPFKSLKVNDFHNDFNVCVIGLVNILKFYQPNFSKNCSLVFISSVAGKIGMPFHASVSVSKSAIQGLCISLAAEFSPEVRVNCISPSLFESKMSSRFLRNEQAQEKIKEKNPLRLIGQPKDISSIINFLLSDESRWITGQNISVDGGMSTLKL